MKNLGTPRPQGGDTPASRFEAAKALAFSAAEADGELIEPELGAWSDRASSKASPEVGCSRPDGWHDYDLSPGGRVEVSVDRKISFIFAEASPFDSHEHFGHEPFTNLRDVKEEGMIMSGGNNCVSLDEWISRQT